MNGAHAGSAHHPLIIGHRGASALAPENTLAAFERALDDGADGLEFDVRLARDRVPVIIHDATLRRTGGRDIAVALLSSDELAETDVGTWFNLQNPERERGEYVRCGVPTLARLLQTVEERAGLLYVELKCEAGEPYAPLVAEVLEVVREHSFTSRVVIESFLLDAVREVKRLAPEVRTAALFERSLSRPLPSPRRMLAQALECDADEIALQHTLARRRTVEAARAAGFDALVWTVDDPAWAKRAVELGLCALITNHPARMRAALDQLRP